jgi:hypothetical protein
LIVEWVGGRRVRHEDVAESLAERAEELALKWVVRHSAPPLAAPRFQGVVQVFGEGVLPAAGVHAVPTALQVHSARAPPLPRQALRGSISAVGKDVAARAEAHH